MELIQLFFKILMYLKKIIMPIYKMIRHGNARSRSRLRNGIIPKGFNHQLNNQKINNIKAREAEAKAKAVKAAKETEAKAAKEAEAKAAKAAEAKAAKEAEAKAAKEAEAKAAKEAEDKAEHDRLSKKYEDCTIIVSDKDIMKLLDTIEEKLDNIISTIK